MSWCWRLRIYAVKHGRPVGILIGLVCLTILVDLLKPWPLKLIVDNVIKDHPLPGALDSVTRAIHADAPPVLLIWLCVATVLLFAVSWSLGVAQAYLQTRVGTAMVYDLAEDLFRRMQRLSLPFHTRSKTGDLVKRITSDCTCARDLFINVLLPSFTAVLTLTGMTMVLWRLDASLAWVALFVIPPMALCIRLFSEPMTRRTYEQFSAQGAVSAQANEILGVLPVVQVFGRCADEENQFQAAASEANEAGLRSTRSQLRFKISVAGVTATGVAVVMGIGGIHVLEGKLTIGSLLVFLSYLQSIYGPLETLAYLLTGWAVASAGAQRVFEVFDSTEAVPEPKHPKRLPRLVEGGAEVRFADVTFGYKEKPVLHEVSFRIAPGETVALVGRSGAGKTALVSLIPRLFDPWAGKIMINGVDVREVGLSDLRRQISFVLQDDFVLPMSVAENIAYGSTGATLADVKKAAYAARADRFINRLKDGYETILGERGINLSGGERQRLSVARAFLKAAPILVMDEPTSALDSETESELMEHLAELRRTRTIFLIAHRLSTVRRADRIFVLENGRIVEGGTHQELIQKRGAYARLERAHEGSATHSTLTIA